MTKLVKKLISIVVYLILILYFAGVSIWNILDFKLMLLTIAGTIILSLSGLTKQISKEEIKGLISWSALTTGYLTAFVFVLKSLNQATEISELFQNIAMDFRTLLYGFVIHIIFSKENTDVINGNNSIELKKELSQEDIYYMFREKGLTQKEAEIARMIVRGLSNKEIADELCIVESTVKKHVSHIFEKMDIKSREELKHISRY